MEKVPKDDPYHGFGGPDSIMVVCMVPLGKMPWSFAGHAFGIGRAGPLCACESSHKAPAPALLEASRV